MTNGSERVKVLVIGATGTVGGAATSALQAAGCEVVPASRTAALSVDVSSPESIRALFAQVGAVDAVVTALGHAPYKPLSELTHDDFVAAHFGKVQAQIDVVQIGTPYLSDRGSFTITTGILAREPILTGTAASMANGALEAFVLAAATELPRGIRINAVSPSVLTEATSYHASFPGFLPVPAAVVGQAYVKSVLGVQTGRVFPVDGP